MELSEEQIKKQEELYGFLASLKPGDKIGDLTIEQLLIIMDQRTMAILRNALMQQAIMNQESDEEAN